MKRSDLLALFRIAGYHNDQRAYTRLLVENRISNQAAGEAYHSGKKQRDSGMKCSCYYCSKGASFANS